MNLDFLNDCKGQSPPEVNGICKIYCDNVCVIAGTFNYLTKNTETF